MTASRSDLDAILSTLAETDAGKPREKLIRRTLRLREQIAIQDDTLQQMRRRRDRVQQRRQKSILFSKSQELALLERLCRKVAGTLCDTSWDKLFVTDPDVVLASKPIKPHRKDARARGERTLKTQTRIKEHKYSSYPEADALVDFKIAHTQHSSTKDITEKNVKEVQAELESAKRELLDAKEHMKQAKQRMEKTKLAISHSRGRSRGADTRISQAATVAHNEAKEAHEETIAAHRAAVAHAGSLRRRLANLQESLRQQQQRRVEREAKEDPKIKAGMYASLTPASVGERPSAWKKMRVGQKLAKDERWPAWLAPKPTLSTNANLGSLTDDQLYMDQFGAYLSETMLSAMDDVVSEIRVMATLSRQVRRIPIRRLVAEPLVSNWFAKWIATVILKNRALVGKTWHKDVILDNIGKQLDECRAFFYDPQRYGAEPRVFEEMPEPPPPAEAGEDEEDDEDDDYALSGGDDEEDDVSGPASSEDEDEDN